MWENIDKARPDSGHYACMRLARPQTGLESLREMFPDGEANDLNFVLFSTSGVHGTYNTIEDSERFLSGDPDGFSEVTFLIVHPRLASVRYGNCHPVTADDIAFLKKLRASSHKAVAQIGSGGGW